MTPDCLDVVIIGAGMAGLTAAQALDDAGWSVRLLDKGRGVGGRMSTRTRDGGAYDHGAQYFTARSPEFRAQVKVWLQQGAAAVWPVRLGVVEADGVSDKASSEDRYVGTPTMPDVLRSFPVLERARFGTTATRVWAEDSGFGVEMHGEELARCRHLLVTTPPVQAAPLLSRVAPELAERCRAVEMAPCWAVMVELPRVLDLPFDGLWFDEGPLAWAARNSSKPGRPPGERWVLHGGPAWSRQYLEAEPEVITQKLLAAFSRGIRAPLGETRHLRAHRWRYSIPPEPLEERALVSRDGRIAVAGDWCAGARVEGAYLSGREAARRLLESAE